MGQRDVCARMGVYIVLNMAAWGVNFIAIGAIDEYIGKTYMEVKHRPLYFVREKLNINE